MPERVMTAVSRTAIVTGASGGIGTAIVRRFLHEGISVCAVDLAQAAEPDEAVRFVQGDVTQKETAQEAVDAALQAFGRLDILVNVAGKAAHGSIEAMPEETWDEMLRVNLRGTFLFSQAVIGAMREGSRGGRIINIGSVVGKIGSNSRPWLSPGELERTANAGYAVAKAGVHAFTYALAKEVASFGITVNAVAPGPVGTAALLSRFPPEMKEKIPVGRFGLVEEVAAAVSYLASDEAGFITGEVLDLNGGLHMD